MTIIEAIFLGIIQGLTEFFPVSSSGHLLLAQYFLGYSNLKDYIVFDLVCHLGTLLALFMGFQKYIKRALFEERAQLWQIGVAILPLFPLLLILKPIKELFNNPHYLGYGFLVTALVLYLGIRLGKPRPQLQPSTGLRDAFVVGIFQSAAILPGVSRSGSTITAGRLIGWNLQEAVIFSFLLAIPTVLGGIFLELIQLWRSSIELPTIGLLAYFFGFLTSFVIGYGALSLLMVLAAKNKFIYFVWYCLFLGLTVTLYFNFL